MTMCVSRPQADSFTGLAKNVTFLQLTDLMNDSDVLCDSGSGTEMLILLLYFNSSSIAFTYCYSPEHKLQYNEIMSTYMEIH